MKAGLAVGQSYEFSLQVTEGMQAQFEGVPIHPLYSTAAMIQHMEWAARQHILPYLEPGEEGAGHQVEIKHLASTPIGATVTIRSTVKDVAAGRVTSWVEAWHEQTKIGEGTFVQAIVPIEKLYGQSSPKTPEESKAEINKEEIPPPAELVDINNQKRLSFEILKWETGLFPCTRYDEWLICTIRLNTEAESKQHEGPFMLRYEIEEWIEAIESILQGTRSGFQSDFLEPVFKVQMVAGEPGEWECTFQLTHPDQKDSKAHITRLTVNKTALQHFSEQLTFQLEGFPSKL